MPVVAAFLLVAAAYAAVQEAANIAWKPTAGNTIIYKMTSTAKLGVGELHYDATITHKVVEIKPDGNVVVEEKQGDIKATLGDQDISTLVPASTVTQTLAPNGEIISRKSDQPDDNQRVDEASAFIYPPHALKPGEIWTRTAHAQGKNTYESTTTYTYVGQEKVGKWDTYKISVDFKETSAPTNMTATGTAWVSTTDGELVRADYQMKNVDLPQMPPSDISVQLMRQ
jgi:hypothetical protein